jgi:hypothetical protein
MSELNDFMNSKILAASGREDGDTPQKQEPSGMSRLLLNAIPKQINIFKKDE